MSAAFVDYDNDGRLDIYTGNMWSDSGQRVTAQAAFMPDAPADVRALYRRHARGNSLFRNRGDGTFEDVSLQARRRDGPLGLVLRRARLRQRRMGGPLRRERHVDAGGGPAKTWTASSGARSWRGLRSTRAPGTPYDDAWRAINQLLIHGLDRQPPAQRAPAQRRPGRLRRRLGNGRPRPRPGRPRPSPSSTTTRTAIPTSP